MSLFALPASAHLHLLQWNHATADVRESENGKMAQDFESRRKRRVGRWSAAGGLIILVIAGTILFSSYFGGRNRAAAPPPPLPGIPVTVASVALETVPLQLTVIGTVEAYSTVSVRSQVNGELMKVHFTQGQFVKKGDLLFTIDPRTFQADLDQAAANQSRAAAQQRQAEANLARDEAQARTAEAQSQRYASLAEKGIVSKEQYEEMRTNAEATAAVVKADQAAIVTARESVSAAKAAANAANVQLGYTTIRSPVDGRTGSLVVNQGNLVKANDTIPLIVINQVNPIYVSFSVPEAQLGNIKRYLAEGVLRVSAGPPEKGGPPENGQLSFIDNAVDSATGTVKLRATFANKEQHLWPGMFVNVVLTLTEEPNCVTVPLPAVQTGQNGQYVFVVKPDQSVESRPVTVARSAGEKAVVASGLTPGETVVTDGQLRLRPGSRIRIAGGSEKQGAQEPTP
jgi:multidrug efflux system membrane fusion protein